MDNTIKICKECADIRRTKKKHQSQNRGDLSSCYFCNQEAVAVCATCLKPICKIHRVSGYGKLSCINCANKGDFSKKRNAIMTFILLLAMIAIMVIMTMFSGF